MGDAEFICNPFYFTHNTGCSQREAHPYAINRERETMRQTNSQTNQSSLAITLAAATVAAMLTAPAVAADSTGANTVSFSGSTAMRGFTTSADFSALTPGSSITVNQPGVGPQTYTAAAVDVNNGIFPAVQLAAPLGTGTNTSPGTPITGTYNTLAYRVEWHEQGSVEGIVEMANDQIGYFNNTPLVLGSTRGPTTLNPIWVQRSSQTAVGGSIQTSGYNTYDPAQYNLTTGTNLQGGQNRVQIAISDVRAVQGFSVAGTAAFDRRAGQAGYGKGNPALGTSGNGLLGLGSASVRRQLVDQTSLNMETTKVDPQTGANYAAGAWNTAGLANTTSTRVAATATTFAANPGTGLTDLNKTDAQWLQTTGRLANGADFNVVTRDVNSGTLNVAANNTGVDPSYVVGENDDGNGNLNSNAQNFVGGSIRFSGKTAGGGQLRPTVQSSRMAIGHLSLSDAQARAQAGAANPLRVLGYRNSADNSATAVQPSIDTISDGTYTLFQYENYVTVKNVANGSAAIAAYKALPGNAGLTDAQAWAAVTDAQTGIKGDNAGNDARDFRNNITNSATQFPTGSSFANPGNALAANSFLPAQLLQVTKAGDGEVVTANPSYDASGFAQVKAAYGANFAVSAASAVTSGTGSLYGQTTVANANAVTANIALTSANYLFGDFDGDGKRDYKDVKYALAAQGALEASGLNNDWLTAGTAATAAASNATVVYNTFKKGDLIVKGDFNSDGKFDGKDLYAIAHGAALADAGKSAAQLANPDNAELTSASGTNISDRYRAGVLYKNAALDYLQTNASAAQKVQATSSVTADPTGSNAFNKFDVNRDGIVNRQDAAIVDGAVGKDYRNMNDQLGAVVATDINPAGTVFKADPTVDQTTPRKAFSLVDAELNDTGDITYTGDFKLIHDDLVTSGKLLDGDANLNGAVDFNDFLILQNNFGLAGTKFTQGNFNFDGATDFNDFLVLQNNFGQSVTGQPVAFTSQQVAAMTAWAQSVPEPTSLAVIGIGAVATLRRRRSR